MSPQIQTGSLPGSPIKAIQDDHAQRGRPRQLTDTSPRPQLLTGEDGDQSSASIFLSHSPMQDERRRESLLALTATMTVVHSGLANDGSSPTSLGLTPPGGYSLSENEQWLSAHSISFSPSGAKVGSADLTVNPGDHEVAPSRGKRSRTASDRDKKQPWASRHTDLLCPRCPIESDAANDKLDGSQHIVTRDADGDQVDRLKSQLQVDET